MGVMFYLFRDKNILPGDYYRMPMGEKWIVRAFCEKIWADAETGRRWARLRK